MTVLAKQKYSISMDTFFKQKNKVLKAFLKQFETIENRKQEKIICNLISDNDNADKNMTHLNS